MMRSTRTLLIFEDDDDLLTIFRFVFEEKGWHVHASKVCDNVIDLVREFSPSLILMDNWIPNIGGIKATRLLKDHSEFSTIPVLYVSANNDVKTLANHAGADAFVAKPFDLEALLTVVEKLTSNPESA